MTVPLQPPPPRRMSATLGAYDPHTRSVPVIASTTNAVDASGAITSWDLERFVKNPVTLWGHNDPSLGIHGSLPIGIAKDIAFDPAVGLTMRVYFAREAANPLAEQIAMGVQDTIVRAVSVGFNALGDGRAELTELSFVPVGADEDAGTPALNPAADLDDESLLSSEELRERVRRAAASLGRHRARLRRLALPAQRTDALGAEVERMDRAPIRLDAIEETPTGGRKIPARLSRTGVLKYRDPSYPDGWRRELRLASEIFKSDSMATLDGASVIDIDHHTAMVTADTWKKTALGHVSDVRADGKFIAATLHVNDGATLDAIARGERDEISCGYRCRLEMTSGVSPEGEAYDCVQRNIRYNHAALCPTNAGRAGGDVRMHLDTGDEHTNAWAVAHFDDEQGETDMGNEATKIITKINLDGREYEQYTKEHFDAVLAHAATANQVKLDAAVLDVQKRLDTVTGERDGLKVENDKLRADKKEADEKMKAMEKDDDEEEDERILRAVTKRVGLLRKIGRLFGKAKDDDEEKKLDAMGEQELMIYALQKSDPKFDAKDADGKPRTSDYLVGRFDMLCDRLDAGKGIDEVGNIVRRETSRLGVGGAAGPDAFRADAEEYVKAQKDAAERARKTANGGAV